MSRTLGWRTQHSTVDVLLMDGAFLIETGMKAWVRGVGVRFQLERPPERVGARVCDEIGMLLYFDLLMT